MYGVLMSRIGKKPIAVPDGVKVEITSGKVKVSGSKKSLEMNCHPEINIRVDSQSNSVVLDNPNPKSKNCRALHGTMRALVNNMIIGLSKGFQRKMEIYGTGYNLKAQGEKLVFVIGFSHSVEIQVPKSVNVQIDTPATRGNDVPARFTLSGYDKHELGQFAANIRRIKPPEPYQGKGIRYADEVIRRKVGKAFAGGTG